MNRKKEEIIGYLSSQSWFPRFMELMNKYQDSEAYKESILAGNKREYTLLSAFPFKELDEEEKIEWIERHNAFFLWFRNMTMSSLCYKSGFDKAQKAREERAITLRKRIERRERNGMRMPKGERVVYQVSTNTAKKNLEAAKMYLAKRKQKKGLRAKIRCIGAQ